MTRSRRVTVALVAVLWTAIAAACAAGAAHAGPYNGGTVIPQAVPAKTGGSGYGEPGSRSLVVHPIAMVGEVVKARGTLPGAARRQVILQRLDARRGWRNVARARVRSTTRFVVHWRADRSGPITLRAVIAKRRAAAAAVAAGAPVADVMVFRTARATYFGPGLYGRETACGQILTPDLHGVAHRRLPCGTLVTITFARREITVPVVDRGPFNAGYSWDLTQATADALGFVASGAIGYMRAKPAEPGTLP